MFRYIIIFTCISFILLSCQTIYNPYENLTICNQEATYYFFNRSQNANIENDNIIIYIEGSGLESVLGVKQNSVWKVIKFTYFLNKYLDNFFDLIVPEKLSMKIGENYQNDKTILKNYTVKNLCESNIKSIDAYLKITKIDNIYLMGCSEGGLLLPLVYNNLKNKHKIKKIVLWGCGALNQYECFKILADSKVEMPVEYRNEVKKIDQVAEEILKEPDSIDKFYLGWPYKRWHSFFNYHPINEFQKIDIPILLIQGIKDFSSPYESAQRLVDEFNKQGKKNLTTNFKDNMGHIPNSGEEIKNIINEIGIWLLN